MIWDLDGRKELMFKTNSPAYNFIQDGNLTQVFMLIMFFNVMLKKYVKI